MADEIKLLPCPYCGSRKLYHGWVSANAVGIYCQNCKAQIDVPVPQRWPMAIRRNWPGNAKKALDMLYPILLARVARKWNRRTE